MKTPAVYTVGVSKGIKRREIEKKSDIRGSLALPVTKVYNKFRRGWLRKCK